MERVKVQHVIPGHLLRGLLDPLQGAEQVWRAFLATLDRLHDGGARKRARELFQWFQEVWQ